MSTTIRHYAYAALARHCRRIERTSMWADRRESHARLRRRVPALLVEHAHTRS